MSQLVATPSTTRRIPWQVRVLAAVVLLLALVTSYGAIYFTFVFEDPEPGPGSWLFVTTFLGINLVATAAAVGLLRGRPTAWRTLVAYGVVGILWCVAKLVFWHETESLVFGAANLLGLGLLAHPATRRHVEPER